MKNKTKTAPKWGTVEWIVAYPYSKMDRKRRLRAEKAVDQVALKALKEGPHTCCLFSKLDKIMDEYEVKLAKSDMKRFERALLTVSSYENAVYDCAFAELLFKAWNLNNDGMVLDGRKGFCK